jgi:hypothetical protein
MSENQNIVMDHFTKVSLMAAMIFPSITARATTTSTDMEERAVKQAVNIANKILNAVSNWKPES